MTLCIDIGNSSIKVGLFEGSDRVRTGVLGRDSNTTLGEFLGSDAVERTGIASVVPARTASMTSALQARGIEPPVVVSASLRLPFEVAYETPATLGADRIAASAGARFLLPDADPLVIIDAGSAVTVDVIAEGRYLGGAISPGPELLHRCLATGTAQLPDLAADLSGPAIGRSTNASIRSGIASAFVEGTRGLLDRIRSELGRDPTLLACGGWAEILGSTIPEIHRVEPHLVLHGIKGIVELNRDV